ncbi:MAG TPA: Ig-like domain-containing protein [Gemmatimonadota bacterium]|nr:Ig-like domain-containing protein [Gemmatimonadota bacterium]
MNRRIEYLGAVLVLMALPLVQACGDSVTGPQGQAGDSAVEPAGRLALSPAAVEIQAGAVVQIHARLNGQPLDAGELEWSSSNPTVAWVSSRGWVEGTAQGSVVITAEYRGAIATSAVTITGRSRGYDEGEHEIVRER